MRAALLNYAAQVAQTVFVMTVEFVRGRVHRRVNGRDEKAS